MSKEFIETMVEFKVIYNRLVMLCHENDLSDELCEAYPFDKSFDELGIDDWVDVTVMKLNQKRSQERQRLFLKIIQELENRDWDYDLRNGFIEVELGNQHYIVSKYDFDKLHDLYDVIDSW